MDRKIMNRIPVAGSLQGEELVYGTDANGVPQYIPVRLIKEVTGEAQEAAQTAADKASTVETSMIRLEQLLDLLSGVKAETQSLLDETRNVLSQTSHQRTRATRAADGVVAERQEMERISELVKQNAFAAQLAKEYADQAARAANSKFNFEITTYDFDSLPDQDEFQVPLGWYAMMVIVDGRLRRRGRSKDWTSTFDGTVEIIKLAVAPATDTWVSIVCGRRN